MRNVAIVVAVLVVLVVIVLAVLAGRRNKRRAALRERFGPEYDVAVKRGKDRRAVEQRLEALAQQRDRLEIHEVAPQEHVRFAREWDAAQARFVDDPGQAVADADGLVNSVLRSRGYPVDSFDDRAALVATDHQDVVEGYRAAHDTFAAHLQGGSSGTEELRQAFLHYREVFGRLNVPAGGGDGAEERADDRAVTAAPQHRAVEAAPAARDEYEPTLGDDHAVRDDHALRDDSAVRDDHAVRDERDEGRHVRGVDAVSGWAPNQEVPRGDVPQDDVRSDRPRTDAALDPAPDTRPADGEQDDVTTPPQRQVAAHRIDPT